MKQNLSFPTTLSPDNRAKLELLGRRVIEARLHYRREALRRRQIVDVVNRHLTASATELQERLNEVNNNVRFEEVTDAVIAAELSKMRF